MLNLSQFSGGPNPGLVGIAAIDKIVGMVGERKRMISKFERYQTKNTGHYDDAMTLQKHTIPTPETTGAPIPMKDRRFIPTPENTGAPVPGTLAKNTAIHPITGQRVPKTPVKRSGYKPTPPGTKPKKKK